VISVRIVITGRVQGVGYRDWARAQARELGLGGWVRNRRDGSVELLAAGVPGAVDEFTARCRRGPFAARVDDVNVSAAAEEAPPGFERRPTC